MKREVILSIQGRQRYEDQEPEVIELVTAGTMEFRDGGWDIRYEESDLTGLAGTTTAFRVGPRGVVLKRTGKLENQMIFMEGRRHESLYQLDIGALMIAVKATKVQSAVNEQGGTVDIHYQIEIEDTAITGLGRINGNLHAFVYRIDSSPELVYGWCHGRSRLRDEKQPRPGQLICFIECCGVRVSDISIVDSPCWSCFLHGCERVQIH